MITPPLTKYTFSDPGAVEFVGSNRVDGRYITIDENNNYSYINDPEWFTMEFTWKSVVYLDNPFPYGHYTGSLFGGASIVVIDRADAVMAKYTPGGNRVMRDFYFDLPLRSFQQPGIRKMIVSCRKSEDYSLGVSVANFAGMDITKDVPNWQDLELIFERDGTTGIIVETSFPLEVTGISMEYLIKKFNAQGLYANVQFNVFQRDDRILHKYTLIKKMLLDFSTYRNYLSKVEVSTISYELNEYLNSFGSLKHDIPVSHIADEKKWNYDRITMLNQGSWTVAEGPESALHFADAPADRPPYSTFAMSLSAPEMTPGSTEHDMKSQDLVEEETAPTETDYFFKAAGSQKIKIRIKQKFSNTVRRSTEPTVISLFKNGEVLRSWSSTSLEDGYTKWEIYYEDEVTVRKGDYLAFGATCGYPNTSPSAIYAETSELFRVEYQQKGNEITDLDVISPESLFQEYMDRVSSPGQFSCEFNWRPGDNYLLKIVAAETLRGFENAVLHGSLSDFLEFMRFYGYEYEIQDRKIIYRPRDEFFRKDITAMELGVGEMGGLLIQSDKKYAYTGIKVGYKKQEYESVNGRFEANGTYEYTTRYKTNQENILNFVCPYRADSIGMELLCWERRNTTTDTKSDNDIFLVALKDAGGFYSTFRDFTLKDKESSVEMFNAPLSPHFFLEWNESLIGINTTVAEFTSSDMSKNAVFVNGRYSNPYGGMRIMKKLFDPVNYNFESGHYQPLPDESVRNGLIYFTFEGVRYKGFIEEIKKNYAQETNMTWDLFAVKD